MNIRKVLVVLTSLALLLSALASSTIAAKPTASVGKQTIQSVKKVGTTRLAGAAGKPSAGAPLAGEVRGNPDEMTQTKKDALIHNGGGGSHVSSAKVPRPAGLSVTDATSTPGFVGLNHRDQRIAGTGDYVNTQFSLEPPDQGLCVGNGYLVETVNTVVRVRSTDSTGTVLVPAVPINQFFHLAPEIIRADPLVYGDFSTDPKCYYDAATDNWFLTVLQIDIDPATGGFDPGAHLLIAVSASGDPRGTWNLYSLNVTNDGKNGTPEHPSCPCFGDQPLIGADANAFVVSTNEYPLFVAGFNGANVYAIDKAALAAGAASPHEVSFWQETLAEGPAYSLQPATTPPGGIFESANGGTEYFLSALEFTGGVDNRIALWALTNTSSLPGTPALGMQKKVLNSEVYGAPPSIIQKDGPTPLRDSLQKPQLAAALGYQPSGEQLNLLNSNDDRMNQAVYAGGQVWGALNTVVKSTTGAARTAIAWFQVSPSWSATDLGGSVSAQGYVAVDGNNVVFPSIAANTTGKVIVGFTLAGPDYYPAAAYAQLAPSIGTTVNVVRYGVGPADGFTGYVRLDPGDNGVERWGDYSAAVADEAGNLWFATETINQSCTLAEFWTDPLFSCGGTRTVLANWGTAIAKVTP